MTFAAATHLPYDIEQASLIGRAMLPEPAAGPAVVTARSGRFIDITRAFPTVGHLLSADDPAAALHAADGDDLGALDAILANTTPDARSADSPYLIAPADTQVIKASGVTFVASMLERVIEERALGDPAKAREIRAALEDKVGVDLRTLTPGSDDALRLREVLLAQGQWSQYLEVGLGTMAEIFTKAAPMSAVGLGSEVGLHPDSSWNNPEPEIVLVLDASSKIVGATLGNDVNLRDFEGRSALLLGRAKDNNASCAIGPMIRLFDDGYTLDDVRKAELAMAVDGEDGFRLDARCDIAEISRDPADLAHQASGDTHHYPDGALLFLGTPFAPIEDRDTPGQGFTHHIGDVVTISEPRLGTLVNGVGLSDQVAPWSFGITALFESLARRGLLAGR